jgi:hypothetical protein
MVKLSFFTLVWIVVGSAAVGVIAYLYFTSSRTFLSPSGKIPPWLVAALESAGIPRSLIVGVHGPTSGELRRAAARLRGKAHFVSAECASAAQDEDADETVRPKKLVGSAPPKTKSTFEKIGHAAFRKMIAQYGGKIELLKENVKLAEMKNPETGRCLELDSYYDDGRHKIAIEYQGAQHSVYPNAYHKSKSEFDAQVRRDEIKRVLAKQNDIFLISVPYTVYGCVKDDNEPSGWRWCTTLSEEERSSRIKSFIQYSLVEYCQDLWRQEQAARFGG